MSKKHREWLYNELPKLVREGVISEEAASNIRQYYGPTFNTDWKQKGLFIFGLLGAVLIGSGIILLLAHNWAELSRPARAGIVIGGLMLAQGLVGWVIKTHWKSLAWREGSTVFLMLMLGAAISLIGQTYNFPGQVDNFLLTWMLLSLPLVYLLEVTLPAVGYVAGLTWWGLLTGTQAGWLLFWLLLGAIIPYYITKMKENINSGPASVLSWGLTISILLAVGFTLGPDLDQLGWLVYTTYFAILCLVGDELRPETNKLWQQPFRVVGYVGLIVVIYLLGSPVEFRFIPGYDLLSYLEVAILLILYGGSLFINWRQGAKDKILFGLAPVIWLLGAVIGGGENFNLILYNGYLLTLGLNRIIRGLKKESISLANLGVAIIAVQIIGRFFFLDVSFLARSLVFIGVGIGFLITNLLVQRRMESEENET